MSAEKEAELSRAEAFAIFSETSTVFTVYGPLSVECIFPNGVLTRFACKNVFAYSRSALDRFFRALKSLERAKDEENDERRRAKAEVRHSLY